LPIPYDKFYEAELAQRDQLRGAVGTPIGILTLLGTVIYTMVSQFKPAETFVTCLFACACGVGVYYVVRAAYFLTAAYHGHVYKRLPTALEFKKYRDDIEEWEKSYGNAEAAKEIADMEAAAYLLTAYGIAADHNAYVNIEKSALLFRCTRATIIAACAIGVAALPFGYNRATAEEEEKVQVVDIAPYLYREHLRHDRQEQRQRHSAAAAPPRPTPPPPKDLREGVIIPRPQPNPSR
jgi:hypothetical protein